ncbi:MAG: hypothetical protein ACKVS6_01715 [Planctomycetota bacterium]
MLIIACVFALGAAAGGCRAAYGVDPERNPDAAAKTPGFWRAELRTGLGAIAPERYILEFDGTDAWIEAANARGGMGTEQWSRRLQIAEYENFVLQALAMQPYTWSDRKTRNSAPGETLKLDFRIGERGRNVVIESPDATERLILERLRFLAGRPSAAAEPMSK